MTVAELIKASKDRNLAQEDVNRLYQQVQEAEAEFAKKEATRKPSVALLRKPFASL